MNSLALDIDYPPEAARVVAEALAVEAADKQPRIRVSVSADEEGLHVAIDADDLPALRAAVNTYLRYLSVSEKLVAH